jgi:hypothetical protein
VVEVEAGVITVKLVQMLCPFDLQGVDRKIAIFMPRSDKKEGVIGENQDGEDGEENYYSRAREQIFHWGDNRFWPRRRGEEKTPVTARKFHCVWQPARRR